jgi:hypothetical protein
VSSEVLEEPGVGNGDAAVEDVGAAVVVSVGEDEGREELRRKNELEKHRALVLVWYGARRHE